MFVLFFALLKLKDTMIIIVHLYCYCHIELKMLPQRCFHCFDYYRPMPTSGQGGQAGQAPGKIQNSVTTNPV